MVALNALSIPAPSKISHWKPYPAYKSSGVEWLGEIPAHWEVKRLKFACQANPSKAEISSLSLDTHVSFLPMERIGEDGSLSLEESRRIEQVIQGYTYIRNGDAVVAKITPCFENGKGALCENLLNGIGFGTTELHVLRAREGVWPKFIFYLTRTYHFRALGTAAMYGAAGQQRVPEAFIRNFRTGFPTLPEQHAIANFLDHETAKIDALVAKKQRLIELLREKRAALISRAVTKGLDPAAPVKDSGVEWLGEIPEHWGSTRLKFVSESIQTGPFGSQLHSDEYVTNGIPLVNPANIQQGTIMPDLDSTIDDTTLRRLSRYVLKKDDIVFARRGEMGRCALVTIAENGWLCGTGSIRVRPKLDTCYAPYLDFVLSVRGVKDWLSLESVGSTMENLNSSILARIPIPCPPVEEQRIIANFIVHEKMKIDALIGKVEAAIEKLQEYRTELISAAVTGKIDVRGSEWANRRMGE